jgi:hypothetical protein
LLTGRWSTRNIDDACRHGASRTKVIPCFFYCQSMHILKIIRNSMQIEFVISYRNYSRCNATLVSDLRSFGHLYGGRLLLSFHFSRCVLLLFFFRVGPAPVLLFSAFFVRARHELSQLLTSCTDGTRTGTVVVEDLTGCV